MNNTKALTIIKRWIIKDQIALFPQDAETNFNELWEMAYEDYRNSDDEFCETIDALRFLKQNDSIGILNFLI